MRPRPPSPASTGGPPAAAETALLAAGAAAAGAAAWFWAGSGLAGWASTGRWPALPLSHLPGALRRLPGTLGDPPAAWSQWSQHHAAGSPGAVGSGLVAPVVFYASSAAVAALLVLALAALNPMAGHGPPPRPAGRARATARSHRGAGWGRARDLRPILVRRAGHRGRLVLGRLIATYRPGRLLATEARHSVLVIGPTQSGKTTGLAIPAILEWPGPVVATSVKDDLVAGTLAWRSSRGPCWVFDPTAGAGAGPLSRWSPLEACDSWSGAQKMATWLVESTPGRRGMADAAFWYTTAGKQLAPLLLAARLAGMGMSDVVRWTDGQEFDEPGRLLQMAGEDDAAVALAACAARDERIRSSVGTTLETVLSPFEDPVVAAATSATDLDVDRLLSGGGTLYLCGPTHEQSRVQGLFAALVSTVVAAAVAATTGTGRPLDPPLLLVLDEAANIAPVRDLDTLASTGAGLGIQLVTVCQDLAQLAARYDAERARTIANNHRAKLLLSGVSDLGTLDLISGLAGEQAVLEETTAHDLRGGGGTRSVSTTFRRLAPTDELRRVAPGHGVLVYGHLPPARVRLRPWYEERSLRERARC